MYEHDSRRLLWHGVFLFLRGLMSGFIIQLMVNRRMGLSDHLVGTMGGMFLAILGLIWSHLRMSKNLLRATFWLALYGSYANWFTTLLAAVWGTHANAPVTGVAFHARAWQELNRRVRVQFAGGCDAYRLRPADLRTPRNVRRIFLSCCHALHVR